MLACGGVIFFMSSWILEFWIWGTMPQHIDRRAGYTISMNIHGDIVYISPIYFWIVKISFWTGLALLLLAALVDAHKDP